MGQVTIAYTGYSEAPISSRSLLKLFDDLWGDEHRSLPIYPKVIGGVHATWHSANGALHHVSDIDELLKAYDSYLTYDIHISGKIGEGNPHYSLIYIPAAKSVSFEVTASTEAVAIEKKGLVERVFPLQKKPIVFISYASDELELAEFVRNVFIHWTENKVDAFIARHIPSGDNPLDVMLEEKLKHAKAIIPICSLESKSSPWIWWESAAVWARGYKVHPLFTNISANDFGPPLTLVSQGKEYFTKEDFISTLRMVSSDLEIALSVEDFDANQTGEFEALRKKYSTAHHINDENTKMTRGFLSILNDELRKIYSTLFCGECPYLYADPLYVLSNYKDFNTSNKNAMWPNLIKLDVFHRNPEIFDRINSVYFCLEELNSYVKPLKPERHNLNTGSIDVHNYRDIMNKIKGLYIFPKGESTLYDDSSVGEFLAKTLKMLS